MQLRACFLLFLLGATLVQAGPTAKSIEKKTLSEDAKVPAKEENLKIEETGEDKGRSKKAAVCLQLESGTSQQGQVAVNGNPLAVHSIPLTVQAQTIPQQVQALSYMQPVAQTFPQAGVLCQQQMVQPMQTLQIVPSQPCPSTSLNIIHTSAPSPEVHRPPPPPADPEPITEPPKPMRIEEPSKPLPVPQDSIAVMPPAPLFEQVIMVPQQEPLSYVPMPQVPHCTNPLHGRITECTCQKVEPVPAPTLPCHSQAHSFAAPAIMTQRRLTSQPIVVAPAEKVRPYFSYSTPQQPLYYSPHQTVYHKAHLHNMGSVSDVGLLGGGHASSLAITGYPHIYRSANPGQQPQFPQGFLRSTHSHQDGPMNYGMNEIMQSNKVPREIDSNQLSPVDEAKQQEGTAMLIDGRRSPRSNKEEKKEPTEKPKKN